MNPFIKIGLLKDGRSIWLPMTILFYNAILAFVMILLMFFNTETLQETYYYDTSSLLYHFLIISSIHLFVVVFITPFIVSGSYREDREQHILSQFIMIPDMPFHYVMAKVWVLLAVDFLVFISSMPILTLSCLYSGMSATKVIRLALMALLYVLWSGCIAIYFYSRYEKLLTAFAGTICTELFFIIGTLLLTEILRNGTLLFTKATEIPEYISRICLGLMMVNPLSSYMGYYGSLTGEAGLVVAFCNHIGVDASSKIFSFLYYKIASFSCLGIGFAFLMMAILQIERKNTGKNL